jgi:hypothetical protein
MVDTAPIRSRRRTLGVARDYAQLHALLRQRAEALNISRETIDQISGLPIGYSGTILAPARRKNLGPISLGAMLGALGLALVVVEDPDALARIKSRLTPKALNAPYSRRRRGLPPSSNIRRGLDGAEESIRQHEVVATCGKS